jgi:hypothetical protein
MGTFDEVAATSARRDLVLHLLRVMAIATRMEGTTR